MIFVIRKVCTIPKPLYIFSSRKKIIRHIGWLSDNLTHFINLRPIILMSIQCGYHSWISVSHATHNSQTKIPNANLLGRLLEMYNLLGTYVSAELTDCRQNLALSSSCRSEKNSFGLRSRVTSFSWEYAGCKTSTNIIKRCFVSFITSHALWIHIEN